MSMGDMIRIAREKMGLTQDEAAAAIRQKYGVRLSSAYLSMIERGERTNLTLKLENALKDFFNIQENREIDILEALEDENVKLTAGEQPITKEQRLSILRALINPKPDIEAKKSFRIPVLGTIRAGTPLLSEENYDGELEIPSDITADFALQVRGDSMIGAGINPGDYAICRQAQVPSNGDIVVAIRHGDATLKYFFDNNGQPVLRAANPEFEDISIDEDWRIEGIMIALLRKETTPYSRYQEYIATRNYRLQDWDEIIEMAVTNGVNPSFIKEMVANHIEMAKRFARDKK